MTGAALVRWRESRGLMRTQLAELLPVALATLQNWERGRTKIPPYLPRALKDAERKGRFRQHAAVVSLAPEESRFIVGQVVTGYSSGVGDYDRLHLANGWAIVLPSARIGAHWFVEDYQALVDASKNRVIHLGCGAVRPRVLVRAAIIQAKLKAEGILHPTEEDVQQACLAMSSITTEEASATQQEVLRQLQRKPQDSSSHHTDDGETSERLTQERVQGELYP